MLLAPQMELRGTMVPLPSFGKGSARATVRTMRRLVNEWKTSPEMLNAAVGVIFNVPAKDSLAEVSALFDAVRINVRYTADIFGVEVLSNPFVTLSRQVGDCDDMATLLATLFETVGYPTRFVIAGYQHPNVFEHVYLQVFVDGEWIDADPTENGGLGWAPPYPVVIEYER